LNGTKTVSYTNLILRDASTSNSSFKYVQVYKQTATNLYRYEDDYVLHDGALGRVGCGSIPAGDTTPPTMPSALMIR